MLTHRSPADLPQCRMKIDFRSRVQASPEFADWLEKMLEPAAEDRFKSAVEALKALQTPRSLPNLSKQLPQNQSLLTGRRPNGSRITLQKTNKRLFVKIPPMGLQTKGIHQFALFGSIAFGFTSIVFYALIRSVQSLLFVLTVAPLFFCLLPFWLIGLSMLCILVYGFFGSSYLEIDASSFHLRWKCLCFSGKVQGQTADIEKVERWSKCPPVIWEKDHKHTFADEVTPVEQDWLVAEISDFLERLSSSKS
ncbi:hypothetical protein IQ258_23975 [Coleofasciculus sp. LEGE 07081]|nr:hypothetical protein [Coleofasciculus sp. LEGE 07081]